MTKCTVLRFKQALLVQTSWWILLIKSWKCIRFFHHLVERFSKFFHVSEWHVTVKKHHIPQSFAARCRRCFVAPTMQLLMVLWAARAENAATPQARPVTVPAQIKHSGVFDQPATRLWLRFSLRAGGRRRRTSLTLLVGWVAAQANVVVPVQLRANAFCCVRSRLARELIGQMRHMAPCVFPLHPPAPDHIQHNSPQLHCPHRVWILKGW